MRFGRRPIRSMTCSPTLAALLAALALAAPLASANPLTPATTPYAKHHDQEAIVSPASLFLGGDVLDRSGGKRVRYRPVIAYDRPEGTPIGKVLTTKPECFRLSAMPESCAGAGAPFLVTKDGHQYALEADQWGYEEYGLRTNDPQVSRGKTTWSRIAYEGGAFWMPAARAEVRHRVDLNTVAGDFETFCTKPGICVPLTPKMQTELQLFKEGKIRVAGCYPEPYEIQKVVTAKGARFYQAKLTELLDDGSKLSLPTFTYIPTKNKDGSPTGTFYARGC